MRRKTVAAVWAIAIGIVASFPCHAQLFVSGHLPQRVLLSQYLASYGPYTPAFYGLSTTMASSPRYYELKAGYFLNALRKESVGLEVGLLTAGPFSEAVHIMTASGSHMVLPIETYVLPTDVAYCCGPAGPVNVVSLNVVGRLGYWKTTPLYGTVRPYVGAGVQTVVLRPESRFKGPWVQSYETEWPTLEAFIGTQIFLLKHLALFTEYKFTHVPGVVFDVFPGIDPTRLSTHHIVSGLSIQF